MIADQARERIDQILAEFDFQHVEHVMAMTDHRWVYLDHQGKQAQYRPNIPQLIDKARQLLHDVLADPDPFGFIESGGFLVTKFNDLLSLYFVVADASDDDADDEEGSL